MTATILLLCLGICYAGMSLLPIVLSYRKVNVRMHKDNIQIKGPHGRVIPYSKIKEITLTSTLPQQLSIKRAISFNGNRKGLFRDDIENNIYLYLDKDFSVPLIAITETDNTRTFLALESREENRRVFNKLVSDKRRLIQT